MRLFARHGVPEYWIVDPVHEQIEVHPLADGSYRQAQAASGDDIVRSVLLPDLTFEPCGPSCADVERLRHPPHPGGRCLWTPVRLNPFDERVRRRRGGFLSAPGAKRGIIAGNATRPAVPVPRGAP